MQAILLLEFIITACLLQARRGICQDLPVFTVHPQDSFSVNGMVIVNCATDNPSDTIQWKFNEEETNDGTSGGMLNLNPFADTNQGYYSCVVTRVTQGGSFMVSSAEAYISFSFLTSSYDNGEDIVEVDSGGYVELPCIPEYTSSPAPRFTWYEELFENYFQPGIATYNSAVYGPNGTIVLRHVNKAMRYRCQIDNDGSEENAVFTTAVMLSGNTVSTSEVFMVFPPEDAIVNAGDLLEMYCITTNMQSVTWSLNGEMIVDGDYDNINIIEEPAYLRITKINSTHAGIYTCNHPTLGQHNATVSVRNPPTISNPPPADTTVNYGNQFSLNCSTAGTAFEYKWYLNGERLPHNTEALLVNPVTYESAGAYQCYAYNEAGNDSFATLVSVFAEAPSIVTPPPSKLVGFVGSSLTILCEASGTPPPMYFWLFGNDLLIDEADEGTLPFDELDSADSGTYICKATNDIGSPATASTQVYVIGPTVIEVAPSPSVKVYLSQDFSLHCNETHDIDASVDLAWFFKGERLKTKERRSLTQSQGTLVLHVIDAKEDDAGEYLCQGNTTVTNYTIGSPPPMAILTVVVTASPVLPVVTALEPLSSTTVMVSWTYDGLVDNIKEFVIETKQVSNADSKWINQDIVPNKAETRRTIYDLLPYTEYMVRIGAVEGAETVYSDVAITPSVTTLESTPEKPTGVTAVPLEGGTSISVSWQAITPPFSNGVITGYTVRDSPTDGSSSNRSNSVSSNVTMYTISDLIPDTEYAIYVAGHTIIGIGQFSERVVATTQSMVASPLTEKVWFILLMVAVGVILILVMGFVIIFAYWRRARGGKYPVSHSMQLSCDGAEPMTEDAIHDYENRKKDVLALTAFDGADSELDGSAVTLPTTVSSFVQSSMRMNMMVPPSYINPPSFEETLRAKSNSMSVIDKHSDHIQCGSGWSMGHEKPDQYDEESVDRQVILGAESGSSEDSGVISQGHSASTNNCATFV